MRAWHWASSALLLAAGSARAQPDAGAGPSPFAPLELSSRVDPRNVRLGQPFEYELALTHLPDQRFELKPPLDWGPFELLDIQRGRTDGSGKAITTYRLRLALFALGTQRLPELDFEVHQGSGAGQFRAPAREVEGVSSLAGLDEKRPPTLEDIKDPEQFPIRSFRLLLGVLVAGAVAALVYAGFRLKRRSSLQAVAAAPPVPLDVRTIQALDSLRAQDLPAQGRAREFYFRLSEIVRGYLGERYGFEALECTSAELKDALERRETPGLPHQPLREFLDTSDLVKFARQSSSPEACAQALSLGYALVQNTFPAQSPSTEQPPHGVGSDFS